MSDTVSNLKVRFSADTKNFKKDMESGKTAIDGFSNQAGDAFSKFASMFGVNMSAVTQGMNEAKKQASAVSAGFKGAAAGGNFLSSALKILKLALIGTGIGAIVVALGSLVTLFSRSTIWADKLAVKLAGFKAIVNVMLDRFSVLGEALIKLISLDLKGAAELARKAFSGITEEIKNEYNAAQKLKDAVLDLERRSKLYEAEKESAMTEIQRLRAIAKDKLTNDNERVKAIQKAGDLEQQISQKSLDLANEELAAALDSYDQKSKTLKLDEKGLELIERIKKGQIGSLEAQELAKELTLDDANAKETLYNLIDKIVAREKEQQSIIQTRIRIQNAENTVVQEIAQKKIASYNAEASLLKDQSDNQKLTYDERIKLIRKAADLEQQAFRTSLDNNIIDRQKYEAEIESILKDLNEKTKALSGNLKPIGTQYGDTSFKKEMKLVVNDDGVKEWKEVLTEESKKVDLQLVINADGTKEWRKVIDQDFETDKLQKFAEDHAKVANDISNVWIDATSVINESFSTLATGFGEAMGTLLSGGEGIKSLSQLVGDTMGDMAIQVGKIAIATGLAVLGIKKALESLNPAVAIAAGVALVALGTFVKNSLGSAASGSSGTYSSNAGVYDTTGTYSSSSLTTTTSEQEPITIYIKGELTGKGKELVSVIEQEVKVRNIRR